jgi:hypothetical protein
MPIFFKNIVPTFQKNFNISENIGSIFFQILLKVKNIGPSSSAPADPEGAFLPLAPMAGEDGSAAAGWLATTAATPTEAASQLHSPGRGRAGSKAMEIASSRGFWERKRQQKAK